MTAAPTTFIERVDAELPLRVLRRFEQGERASDEDIVDLNAMDSFELRALIAESLIDGDDEDWVALVTMPIRARTFRALHELKLELRREAERARALTGEGRSVRLAQVRNRRDQIHRWIELGKAFTAADHQAHLLQVQQEKAARIRAQESANQSDFGEAALLLAAAIKRHYYAAMTAGLEPEPSDRDLWSVLDRIMVPSTRQGQIPVHAALTNKNWLGRLTAYLDEAEGVAS